ncbi:MAG: pirin family protein [Gammaproteobacteria bacterium]|nr:pirin family protein [Gammaproteobacteria bacterium]MBU1489388.1 pirin family protein [Gammaproteobacteria bacterium]MBU2065219.1 pirin family protein [Gammaproteobacteria bacterium]MBU2141100.1 pirin family protein [Gammaproteobacteria bacterium]MBU2215323.1 pirin family protein [Gammaproteobacteria bacterium]
MNTQAHPSRIQDQELGYTTSLSYERARVIAHRTRGSAHGPITRLISPGDWGQLLKPFVFLDIFSTQPDAKPQGFGMHPHSGIATLTYMVAGEVIYEDTTGKKGVLPAGGVEWMRAGNGIWHSGTPVGSGAMCGFQLWVALPAAQENAPAESLYLDPSQVPQEGPARVLLGRYGNAESAISAPSNMTYMAVTLKSGEHWHFTPPADHTVAWLAVSEGRLQASGCISSGEMAVFEESEQAIDFVAHGPTTFVLGSAVKHPHALVMGYYSVHTSKEALAQGEAEIQRIGARLRRDGRLR